MNFLIVLVFLLCIILMVIAVCVAGSAKRRSSNQTQQGGMMLVTMHGRSLIPTWIIMFSGVIFAACFFSQPTPKSEATSITLILMPLCFICFFLSKVWQIGVTELLSTPERIYGKYGWFKLTRLDIPMAQLTGISVEQGFIGKKLDYASIVIAAQDGYYTFKDIRHAKEFQEFILSLRPDLISGPVNPSQVMPIASGTGQQSVSGVRFCPSCGNPITSSTAFCSKCGNKVAK